MTEVSCQEVLDGDIRWTQHCEGYSLPVLDDAIKLVTQRGFKVRYLLCSSKRYFVLMPHLNRQQDWSTMSRNNDYQGCRVMIWDQVFDDCLYVVGDQYPPTPESIAVMTWRRP